MGEQGGGRSIYRVCVCERERERDKEREREGERERGGRERETDRVKRDRVTEGKEWGKGRERCAS